jgi:hypothetical protein
MASVIAQVTKARGLEELCSSRLNSDAAATQHRRDQEAAADRSRDGLRAAAKKAESRLKCRLHFGFGHACGNHHPLVLSTTSPYSTRLLAK